MGGRELTRGGTRTGERVIMGRRDGNKRDENTLHCAADWGGGEERFLYISSYPLLTSNIMQLDYLDCKFLTIANHIDKFGG